jgi:Luciferase-like monooxygenase
MQLGRIGVWIGAFAVAPAAEAGRAAREIEELGYDTLWYPEGLGTRESFTNGAVLLAATERIRVASGIATIWGRDAVAAANAARVLADAFDDRFLLGLGVSHPRQVDPRGHRYAKPVARMSFYLDAMDDDPFVSPDAAEVTRPPVPRVLAALVELVQALASRLRVAVAAFGAADVEVRPRGQRSIRLPLGIYLGLPRGPLELHTTEELLRWLADPERATETQLQAATRDSAERQDEPRDGIVRLTDAIRPRETADQATPLEPPMPIRGWERWCPCKRSKYLAGLERRGERHFTYLMIAAEAVLHAELSEEELIEIQLAMPLNGNSRSTESERRSDARSNARSVLEAKAEEPVLTGCPRNERFADTQQSPLRSVFAHHCTEERSRVCPLLHPVWPRQTAYGPLLESSIWRGSQGGGSGVGLAARNVYEFAVMRSHGVPGPVSLTGRYLEARLPYLTRKSADAALNRLVEIGLLSRNDEGDYILEGPVDAQAIEHLEKALGTHEHAARALERSLADWQRSRTRRQRRQRSSTNQD